MCNFILRFWEGILFLLCFAREAFVPILTCSGGGGGGERSPMCAPEIE